MKAGEKREKKTGGLLLGRCFFFVADVSDIFLDFLYSGAGEREEEFENFEVNRKGGDFLLGNRGEGFPRMARGGAHRGWEGVAGSGGGVKYLFRGRTVHQVNFVVWGTRGLHAGFPWLSSFRGFRDCR